MALTKRAFIETINEDIDIATLSPRIIKVAYELYRLPHGTPDEFIEFTKYASTDAERLAALCAGAAICKEAGISFWRMVDGAFVGMEAKNSIVRHLRRSRSTIYQGSLPFNIDAEMEAGTSPEIYSRSFK